MADGTHAALRPLSELPSLPKLPLVGALPWVLHPEGFVARMLQHVERRPGIRSIALPRPDGRSPIFVGSARMADDLVDEARFEKVLDGPFIHIRDFAGDGLFTAHSHEESWHRANRILAPGFSSASMERYYPAMLATLEELLAHWRAASGPVDVVADMTKLTLDTISRAGFDHRFDSFSRPELHPFLQALARCLQETIDLVQRPLFLARFFRARRARYHADIASMFRLVDEVIRERQRQPEERWPRDFLSLMLAAKDPKSGERLTDENIRYQILTFLIAGHETTAGLLSFSLHALARDRELLRRVREEVDAHVQPGALPTMKEVLELDLVKRVLSEALRLWPTVPIVIRAAKEDTRVGDYFAPSGQAFGLFLSAVHRDPAVWPDPTRFDPDRFLPHAVRSRPAAAYKPFGIGKRACTGRHFAMIEATLCLAVVAREFDFDDPGPLRIAPTASPKPGGFRLRLRRRADRR
jgi:cytochrome P450 / NADPH-cytochrome P450 reductase